MSIAAVRLVHRDEVEAADRPTHEKARAPCDRSGRSGRHIALESLEPSPQAASMVPASRTRSNAPNRRARCAQRGNERACRHGSALSDSRRPERPQPHATLLELPHESLLQFTDAERASRRPSHSVHGQRQPAREWTGDVERSTVADAGRGVYQASGTPAAQAACRVVANDRLEAEELASLELASGVDETRVPADAERRHLQRQDETGCPGTRQAPKTPVHSRHSHSHTSLT